jgi:hypothetical protein
MRSDDFLVRFFQASVIAIIGLAVLVTVFSSPYYTLTSTCDFQIHR